MKKLIVGVVSVIAAIPIWMWIGGFDCNPPKDDDLLLPEYAMPYTSEDNGWAILSNVLCRLERQTEEACLENPVEVTRGGYDFGTLQAFGWPLWYVNPNNEEYILRFNDVSVYPEDIDEFLAHFTNRITSSSYADVCLKSSEWLLAGIDATVTASRYEPPSAQTIVDSEFCMPVTKLLAINDFLLVMRIKCELEKGNFDTAIEYFGRNLRLATLLQIHCSTFLEYLVGNEIASRNVGAFGHMMDDVDIPLDKLEAVDELLKDLPGLSKDAFAIALKREYVYEKEWCMKEGKMHDFTLQRMFASPKILGVRYAFHPNRTICSYAESIRDAIASEAQVAECRGCRYRKTRWYDRLVPNWVGHECHSMVDYKYGMNQVHEAMNGVETVRRKIAEKIAGGADNTVVAAHIRYFPLVFTNGCYYTSDLKRLVGLDHRTDTFVVGDDVEIGSAADFSAIKSIVVPPQCKECLEKWSVAFSGPVNLNEVIVAKDHPEIDMSGGILFDRQTKRLLNFIGDAKTIVVPEDISFDPSSWLFAHLGPRKTERLHFCGSLPELHLPDNPFAKRIKRWWRYKDWYSFKRIFAEPKRCDMLRGSPSNLVVTVSRQNADGRTCAIVEKGTWEGRPVRWGEP